MELQHAYLSTKWFARFMLRHRLSPQKLKRNQKLPLSDVYPLVNKFCDYIRRTSQWAPSRGPMGAFLPRDVCNMDESPLNLYGDQAKLSVNDIRLSRTFVQLVSKRISKTFGFCDSIESGFLLRYTNFGPIGSFPSYEKKNVLWAMCLHF